MAVRVFDDIARADARPSRHGEGRFKFLNRSASAYFGYVRDVIEEWFSHVPPEHQGPLRGALRADDLQSASAFWELYLHEAYRRSGFEIEIHPEIPNRSSRPDFCLARGGVRFYLEAVSVGRATQAVAEDHRLDQVHRSLSELKVEDFWLELSTYGIGPRSLKARKLRHDLRQWLKLLDPDAVALPSPSNSMHRLPELVWENDGWSLEFRALPRGERARGTPRSALGMWSSGEASIIDNVTGIRRAIESKRKKYGHLDAPLVIAIQSNTEPPTDDYEVEEALYGISARRPAERAQGAGHLVREGFWIAGSGWRNAEVSQVLTISELCPWTVTKVQPRCWSTLEPGVVLPIQPDWLAPMIVVAQSLPGAAASIAAHLDLADDWPGMAKPDFDLS